VLEQEQNEAYSFSKIMIIQAWAIIILSELIVIIISILMAHLLARPINILASRIRKIDGGNVNGRIETFRHDEIGDLIKSFNDMTERLRRARAREWLSVLGEASAGITHEFKNSLVSLKSFIQLFPKRHSDEKFVETFNKLIPDEIRRWERMLKDLSNFSANYELKPLEVNVEEIIRNVVMLMGEELQQNNIIILFEIKAGMPFISADPERLKQVFMNLIINAVKAMPNGGSLVISESLVAPDDSSGISYIEIRIADTGVGIEGEFLDKIFKPFHTTNKGSLGLGLAISRRIIEQHGGTIAVESMVGIGTTFIIRLPVERISLSKSDTRNNS
jgi:signal transduction histidine kinase